jgi:hypothetical protein
VKAVCSERACSDCSRDSGVQVCDCAGAGGVAVKLNDRHVLIGDGGHRIRCQRAVVVSGLAKVPAEVSKAVPVLPANTFWPLKLVVWPIWLISDRID